MASIAFTCWNPFQVRHFLPVLNRIPDATLVLEIRGRRASAVRPELVNESPVPVVFWPSRRMRALDGMFDVIVCQTRFDGIEEIRHSKVAMLMYGLAKETYNYGEWRRHGQLHLAYGPRSKERLETYGDVVVVGNPRFDQWHEPSFHERARRRFDAFVCDDKKTVLYAPTWGDLASVDRYFDAVVGLSSEHTVLIKIHHNTDIIERERRVALAKRNVHLFGADDDIYELLSVSDVLLSDYSGAIFDGLCAKRPVILLQGNEPPDSQKIDHASIEYAARDRIGPVVTTPSELRGALETHFRAPALFGPRNSDLCRQLIDDRPDASGRAAEALRAYAERHATHGRRVEARRAPRHLGKGRGWVVRARRRVSGKIVRSATSLMRGDLVLDATRARQLSSLTRTPEPILLAARAAHGGQQVENAWELLSEAQRAWPDSRRVLMALTELHRQNAADAHARATLRFETLLDPVHGGTRQLSMEVAAGDVERAEAAFDRLLANLQPGDLETHLPAIQRAASALPSRASECSAARRSLESLVESAVLGGDRSGGPVAVALASRALPLARRAAVNTRCPAHSRAVRDYAKVQRNLGSLVRWAELAWENETGRGYRASNGVSDIAIHADALTTEAGELLVDFFIPSPLFELTDAKPTHETVRRLFRTLGTALARRTDVAVVPRLQFNWRAADVSVRPSISYHTHDEGRRDRLHVQEATLPDRASLDVRGYAGFSRLSVAPTVVDDFARARTDDDRRRALNDVRTVVVHQMRSKYHQGHVSSHALPPSYVFVPMQVPTDPVATLSWIDCVDLLRAVAESFRGTDTRVVAKRHPYCRSLRVEREMTRLRLDGLVVCSDASIHHLISRCRMVVTVNSGVGMEALAFKKPVVTTGSCEYGYATTHAANMQDLMDLPNASVVFDESRAMRFFDYYTNMHTVLVDDHQRTMNHIDAWIDQLRSSHRAHRGVPPTE
ncbi:MAG: CDP-glycerol glycerophosphotransferase family protein [Polyangiales bacterium]